MSDDTPIRDVADTAFMVAAFRAREGERPDALFHDPLSGKLAGERGRRILEAMAAGRGGRRHAGAAMRTGAMTWFMAIRTRVIDEMILAAIAEGADAIVNLGAGLDTRPYRLELPASLVWIEADLPGMIDYKEERLAQERPRCRLERVRLDLRERAARSELLSALGTRFREVLVLTEGVIPYLTAEDVGRLAEDLRAQPSCRRWIAEYLSPRVMGYRRRAMRATRVWMRNAPFLFDPQDFFGFFRAYGWRPRVVRSMWEEAQRLGRRPQLPWFVRAAIRLRRVLLSRRARERLSRGLAYVLFEPAIGPDGESPGGTA
ncbi:MAG TPA: SAM-dependent methyltransferase [Steroidobacteraceae bacterium]|nr:SAM-dependent methyltransferase [Steroidobacteraceae bacterium]